MGVKVHSHRCGAASLVASFSPQRAATVHRSTSRDVRSQDARQRTLRYAQRTASGVQYQIKTKLCLMLQQSRRVD